MTHFILFFKKQKKTCIGFGITLYYFYIPIIYTLQVNELSLETNGPIFIFLFKLEVKNNLEIKNKIFQTKLHDFD